VNSVIVYQLTSAALIVIGLYGAITAGQWLRKIMAVNVMGGGVFLLLVATAYPRSGELPDPVPHALVLTGIVVAVSATGVALALEQRLRILQAAEAPDATPDRPA
jgi:multicomponent Na+:H+ antiporter subunit C